MFYTLTMRPRILIGLLAATTIPLIAYAGTLTMTTYYPAPTGNYDVLNASSIGIGTVTTRDRLTVAGSGTGYAVIGGLTGCGSNVTGIQLNGSALTCNDHNMSMNGNNLRINRPSTGTIIFRHDNSTQMTLDATGNLGIGITPTSLLHVNGASNLVGAVTMGSTASIAGAATITGATTLNGVTTLNNSTTANSNFTVAAGGLSVNAGVATTLSGPATAANGLTVSAGGLAVTGATSITGNTTITGNASVSGTTTHTGATTLTGGINGGATVNTGNLTVTVGNLAVNAGNLTVGGTSTFTGASTINNSLTVTGNVSANGFFYSSDKRLKTQVQPIFDPIEKVKQLKGVTFRWKKDRKKSVGIIAQDVEKVFPELVHTDKQGMKSVAYPNLIGLLIETTKEQQKQIDALKKEVAQLRKEIKR